MPDLLDSFQCFYLCIGSQRAESGNAARIRWATRSASSLHLGSWWYQDKKSSEPVAEHAQTKNTHTYLM